MTENQKILVNRAKSAGCITFVTAKELLSHLDEVQVGYCLKNMVRDGLLKKRGKAEYVIPGEKTINSEKLLF